MILIVVRQPRPVRNVHARFASSEPARSVNNNGEFTRGSVWFFLPRVKEMICKTMCVWEALRQHLYKQTQCYARSDDDSLGTKHFSREAKEHGKSN